MYESTVGPYPKSIIPVVVRPDFLKVVEAAWTDRDGNDVCGYEGLNMKKVRELCPTDDLNFNAALSESASEHSFFKDIGIVGGLPWYGLGSYYERMDQARSQFNQQAISDYLYGRVLGQNFDTPPIYDNPVGDQYKLLAKGSYLFVGAEPGFVAAMENRSNVGAFLTDCLEMCRATMQTPALFQSLLYRRFVFTNVNS